MDNYNNPHEQSSIFDSQEGLSDLAKDYLRKTHGWVMFFAILTLISAVFLGLGSFSMLLMGSALFNDFSELGVPAGFSEGMGVLIFVIYLLLAAFYGWIGYTLYGYASKLKKYLSSDQMEDIEEAFRHQQLFWASTGILVAVGMGLYILLIFVVVFAGIGSLM